MWCAGGLFEASQAVLIMRFAEGRRSRLAAAVRNRTGHLAAVGAGDSMDHQPGAALSDHSRHDRTHGRCAPGRLRHHQRGRRSLVRDCSRCSSIRGAIGGHPTFWDTWSTTLLYHVLIFLIAYALILTITYLVDSRENIARQMTETARLNEELSKAQLAALRRQMEPHFMFNTLNSIAGLVRDRRNDAAVSMIVGLSEFLRRASEDSHRSQVTLAEEVEYLQRYVDIQKVRFGERLRVSVDIPADLLDAQVPNLLLQPLVENAIKHGVATRVVGGNVRVTGARRDGSVYLSVYNDGPSFPDDWQTNGAGVGLANLRTRLQILHGDASELQMRRAGADGVEVVVTLPLKEV